MAPAISQLAPFPTHPESEKPSPHKCAHKHYLCSISLFPQFHAALACVWLGHLASPSPHNYKLVIATPIMVTLAIEWFDLSYLVRQEAHSLHLRSSITSYVLAAQSSTAKFSSVDTGKYQGSRSFIPTPTRQCIKVAATVSSSPKRIQLLFILMGDSTLIRYFRANIKTKCSLEFTLHHMAGNGLLQVGQVSTLFTVGLQPYGHIPPSPSTLLPII